MPQRLERVLRQWNPARRVNCEKFLSALFIIYRESNVHLNSGHPHIVKTCDLSSHEHWKFNFNQENLRTCFSAAWCFEAWGQSVGRVVKFQNLWRFRGSFRLTRCSTNQARIPPVDGCCSLCEIEIQVLSAISNHLHFGTLWYIGDPRPRLRQHFPP